MSEYAKVFKLKIDTPPDGLIHMVPNNVYTVAALYNPKAFEVDSNYVKMLDALKTMALPPGHKLNITESYVVTSTPGCPWSLRQSLYNNGFIEAGHAAHQKEPASLISSAPGAKEKTCYITSDITDVSSIVKYFWDKYDKKSIVQEYVPELQAIKDSYAEKVKDATRQYARNEINREFQLRYEWMF